MFDFLLGLCLHLAAGQLQALPHVEVDNSRPDRRGDEVF